MDVKNIIKDIVKEYGRFIGSALARGVTTVIDKISEIMKLKDKCLAVMIDDIVQSIGLNEIEGYIFYLKVSSSLGIIERRIPMFADQKVRYRKL